MALQGQIKEFGLTEIFQLIQIQKRDGVLTLSQGKIQAMVLFENGSIVLAKIGSDDEWTGIIDLLVRAEKVSNESVHKAIKDYKKGSGLELGPYMVKKGVIKNDLLQDAVKLYVQESLFQLFSWRSGAYKFEARTVNYNRDFLHPMNTEFLLMEGMRRIDEWRSLMKAIPDRNMIFERTEKSLVRPEEQSNPTDKEGFSFETIAEEVGGDNDGGLGAEEHLIYEMIDGQKTVSDLVDHSMLGEFVVYKSLMMLKTQELIRPILQESGEPFLRNTLRRLDPVGAVGILGNYIMVWIINGVLLVLVILLIFLSFMRLDSVEARNLIKREPFRVLILGERIDRVHNALHQYYLRYGAFPDTLDRLVDKNLLAGPDRMDPWGRPWLYRQSESGFELGMAPKSDISIDPPAPS